MLLATPVLSPLWQVKMSTVKKHLFLSLKSPSSPCTDSSPACLTAASFSCVVLYFFLCVCVVSCQLAHFPSRVPAPSTAWFSLHSCPALASSAQPGSQNLSQPCQLISSSILSSCPRVPSSPPKSSFQFSLFILPVPEKVLPLMHLLLCLGLGSIFCTICATCSLSDISLSQYLPLW